jgi:DNA-binding NtrC family response regulator
MTMEIIGGHDRPVVGSLWGLWSDGRVIANVVDYASASRRTAKPAHVGRDVKQVLFVDPDPVVGWRVCEMLEPFAVVEACSAFDEARKRLLANPPDVLVTNLRLETHNGLHLVHLLRSVGAHTRCVVFGTDDDLPLAREVQAMDALFVQAFRLPAMLPAFVSEI